MVLLLHGFPQFWWAWRHQLTALAGAGYRVAAMDLRGYGASDKPPRGYDTPTLCADVAGVIRSLGATDAVVVGHDWGAWLAWSMPSLQPRTTRAVAVLSSAHPLRMQAWPLELRQLWGIRHAWGFQVPIRPERRLIDGDAVALLLQRWAAPGWPGPEEARRYTDAMRLPFVAHSAMEYYRWAVRSVPRQDGRRFASAVRHTIAVPVLQLHGALDTYVTPAHARSSSRFVRGQYRWELVDGAGHFLAEEAPEATSALLLDWLDSL
ncbi:MAG TPA: alpha/beta hydrolase [Actinomycetales bacterium]|nr:alpha/beta hydrolase [Actinomycetales bacterium]